MIVEQHYDEEVLIALLDEQKESAAHDPHIASCLTCTTALQSIRQVTTALHDDSVWEKRELSEQPVAATANAIRNFASSVAAEDAAAEPHVKALLARPKEEWAEIIAAHPEWRTAGFVRKLIGAVDEVNYRDPIGAVEVARCAATISRSMPDLDSERGKKRTATAWREYAYALWYVGSYKEAEQATAYCRKLLESCAVYRHDLARVDLLQAYILVELERFDEAITLSRLAEQVLEEFDDQRRAIAAKLFESSTLIKSGRFAESLPIALRLAKTPSLSASYRASAAERAAICYRESRDFEEARKWFADAIATFEKIGEVSNAVIAKQQLARTLLAEGLYEKALRLSERNRRDFSEFGMIHNVALSAVDSAEALLMMGQPSKVTELCRDAIRFFSSLSLTHTRGSLMALAYLQEAADNLSLRIADLRQVRTFFEALPRQPELLFAPPN